MLFNPSSVTAITILALKKVLKNTKLYFDIIPNYTYRRHELTLNSVCVRREIHQTLTFDDAIHGCELKIKTLFNNTGLPCIYLIPITNLSLILKRNKQFHAYFYRNLFEIVMTKLLKIANSSCPEQEVLANLTH